MRNLILLFLLLLSLSFLTACRQTADTRQSDKQSHLRIATPYKIQHLDPLKSGHYFLIEFGVAEMPARLDDDGKITPWLLESFEQIDELNWRLCLRPNVKFQNGKLLTPEIFARALNRQIENGPETKAVIGDAKAKTSGNNEVILNTKTPNPTVPAALADETAFPIYDVETVEAAAGDSLKLAASGAYTGAYKIAALTDREMLLEKNKTYWQGVPNFEKVSVLFVSDPQARVLAVQNDEADISLYPQTQNKRMLDGRDDAFYKLSDKSRGGPGLFFNLKNAPFDEVNVRRAVSLGLNYETLANETLDGIYTPADGFYPPAFPWAKQNQKSAPEEARQLLEASGWLAKANDTREKNGARLEAELLIYPQQADFSALATAIQAQLKTIGFDVKIRQIEDINGELKNSKTWHMGIQSGGIVSTGGSPDAILRRYFLSDSPENYFGIRDGKLDEKINLLNRTFDEAQRSQILGEIQDSIITENAYLVRLAFTRSRAIVGKNFRNYQPSPQLFHVTFETKAD